MAYKPFAEKIIFDGVNLSDYFDINEVDIGPFPEIEVTSIRIPGEAGMRYCSRDIGRREIVMNLSVKSNSRDPISVSRSWRDNARYLLKDEPKALHISDDRTIYALPTSTSELKRLGRRGMSEVTFTAFDPFFYSGNKTVRLFAGQNKFMIAGDYECWPVITLTDVSSPVSVTNYLTGDVVRMPSVLNPSARIEIDMREMRCTINGSYSAVDLNVTDYFALNPGLNDIRLSSGRGTLTYREVYL